MRAVDGVTFEVRAGDVLIDGQGFWSDPQARVSILEFVRGLAAQGTAVLYTSHSLEEGMTVT